MKLMVCGTVLVRSGHIMHHVCADTNPFKTALERVFSSRNVLNSGPIEMDDVCT